MASIAYKWTDLHNHQIRMGWISYGEMSIYAVRCYLFTCISTVVVMKYDEVSLLVFRRRAELGLISKYHSSVIL